MLARFDLFVVRAHRGMALTGRRVSGRISALKMIL